MAKEKAKQKPKQKEAAEYRAEVNYAYGPGAPRMEILRDNMFAGPKFDMKDINDEETRQMAREYAAEMKREGRGMRKGGMVKSKPKATKSRGDGCCVKGKTKGRMV